MPLSLSISPLSRHRALSERRCLACAPLLVSSCLHAIARWLAESHYGDCARVGSARPLDGASESEAEQQIGAVAVVEVIALVPRACVSISSVLSCTAGVSQCLVSLCFCRASLELCVPRFARLCCLAFVPCALGICKFIGWLLCLCCVVLGRCKFVCLLSGALWHTIRVCNR